MANTPQSLIATQATLGLILTYVFWRLIRRFVVKSSLSNVAGPPSKSWWNGNFSQVFDAHGWQFHHDIVEKYGSVVKFHGLLGSEQLYVTDPRALHHVLMKEQDIYEESELFLVTSYLLFGKSLLSTMHDQHKKQRKMLNPVFSIKYMRGLIDVFYPIMEEMRDLLQAKVQKGEDVINAMQWMSRAALECIGQGGLGHSFEALDESKTNEYNEAVKMLGPLGVHLMTTRMFLPYIVKVGSAAFRRKLIDWGPSKYLRTAKKIADVMDDNAKDIYAKKKAAFARGDEKVVDQIGRGKDLLSILMRANMAADQEDKLPEDEVLGQMNILIFAGHDTTTSATTRILYELSMHQDVQDKLREEIMKAHKEHSRLDYDTLMALPYLDAVCRETLRMYPPAAYILRTTRKDVVMPLQFPVKAADGKSELSEIFVKKGTTIVVSILGANRSLAIWGKDAGEWKPDRWLKPVVSTGLPGVYSSMLTFGGGGRACIGFKMAEMEMKLVLSLLLETLVFKPAVPDGDICWHIGDLSTPARKSLGDKMPELPLKISLV